MRREDYLNDSILLEDLTLKEIDKTETDHQERVIIKNCIMVIILKI